MTGIHQTWHHSW